MSNDLIATQSPIMEAAAPDEPKWDLPPTYEGEAHLNDVYADDLQRANKADRDAQAARQRGDEGYATLREADAADNRQVRWDIGDGRTWIILFGFALLEIAIAVISYLMPYGANSSATPIRLY